MRDLYMDHMDKILIDTSTYTMCDKRTEDTTTRNVKVHMTKYNNEVYDEEIDHLSNVAATTS